MKVNLSPSAREYMTFVVDVINAGLPILELRFGKDMRDHDLGREIETLLFGKEALMALLRGRFVPEVYLLRAGNVLNRTNPRLGQCLLDLVS